MPCIAMSRIKHLVLSTWPDDKKASPDEKARAAKPNSLSRWGNDSRTDSSSSTTDTSERSLVLRSRLESTRQQCCAAGGASIVRWYCFRSALLQGRFSLGPAPNPQGFQQFGSPPKPRICMGQKRKTWHLDRRSDQPRGGHDVSP